jgi:hypothetical protein
VAASQRAKIRRAFVSIELERLFALRQSFLAAAPVRPSEEQAPAAVGIKLGRDGTTQVGAHRLGVSDEPSERAE